MLGGVIYRMPDRPCTRFYAVVSVDDVRVGLEASVLGPPVRVARPGTSRYLASIPHDP
jgi:hypothetical protein